MTVTKSNKIYPKLYHYAIRYFDDSIDEFVETEGITAGVNYATAAQNVEKIYDSDIVYMNLYETFPVISVDELDGILNS